MLDEDIRVIYAVSANADGSIEARHLPRDNHIDRIDYVLVDGPLPGLKPPAVILVGVEAMCARGREKRRKRRTKSPGALCIR